MDKIYGYVLFGLGLVAIAFTFLLGYQLYQTINPSSFGNGLSGSLSYSVKLLVLFILIGIGFKLSDMGLKIVSDDDNDVDRRKSARAY